MSIAYLSLGSNLGHREANLEHVCDVLEGLGVKILKRSGFYETKPWGGVPQPDFMNQAVMVETDLGPRELVSACKEAEKSIGRVETVKWGPRIVDVDVIFYEDLVVDELDCKIPHPLMQERMFVLEPLAEVAGDFVHPILGVTVLELVAKR